MRIYRYIPDAGKYRRYYFMQLSYKWWPDGIDLGPRAERTYARSYDGEVWAYEGNNFPVGGRNAPYSDFPALSLNVPALSPRALDALRPMPGLEKVVAIHIGEADFFAVQPPVLEALDPERSEGIFTPRGEPLFYTKRWFDENLVTADLFWVSALMPISDVYVTERFVDAALAHGLTGLDYLELVWDGAPVVARYPPTRKHIDAREFLEQAQLLARRDAHRRFTDDPEYNQIVEQMIADGYLPLEYVHPTLTKD